MALLFEELLCIASRVFVNHPRNGLAMLGYLNEKGSASAELEESATSANPAGEIIAQLSEKEIDSICGLCGAGSLFKSKQMADWAKREVEWLCSKGVKIISFHSPLYPPLLRDCPDAPAILYCTGSIFNTHTSTDATTQEPVSQLVGATTSPPRLAVVGTRLVSSYGRESCNTIIKELAATLGAQSADLQIVSGLAYGADSSAHKAALANGLKTIAVLPCGIDSIYPSSNRKLAIEILHNGALITEFPRATAPFKGNFLQRNRIIAGMSHALLVLESRIKGGSMSTVSYANSYNRDVFAVPGRLHDINSYGCNYLITKNVAQLCLSAKTILNSMGWGAAGYSEVANVPDLFSSSSSLKGKLLLYLTPDSRDADYLVAKTGAPCNDVMLALLELELEGKIEMINEREYARL